eukprot:TRINITY_DN5594_c0_g1_i3.p1 TRINITY_DN5594_c0_g1~~TRINITY_DN5594_c0_g1_i3.p1  ORF type:complete len:544 (+),score=113.29 TRINITY_DN5594_c0_g1_i3:77-1708(+)
MISLPVLYGHSRGHVRYLDVRLSMPVKDLLKKLKSEFKLEEPIWGLLLREEGIWLKEEEVLGQYPVATLISAGVELRPTYAPITLELADGTMHVIHVNRNLPVQRIIQQVCKKMGLLPYGFCLLYDNEYLSPLQSLEEQGVWDSTETDKGKTLLMDFRFLPNVNSYDNPRSIHLKFLGALRRFRSEYVKIDDSTEKKKIIKMASAAMVANGISDIDFALENYVPKSWQDAYNVKAILRNVFAEQIKELDLNGAHTLFLNNFVNKGPTFEVYSEDNHSKCSLQIDYEGIFLTDKSGSVILSEPLTALERYGWNERSVWWNISQNSQIKKYTIIPKEGEDKLLMDALDTFIHLLWVEREFKKGEDDEDTFTSFNSVLDNNKKDLIKELNKNELATVSLHSPKINSESTAREIANAIASCTSLKRLSISDCSLSMDSFSILLTGIQNNKTIKTLNFPGIVFTDDNQTKYARIVEQVKLFLVEPGNRKISFVYNDFATGIATALPPGQVSPTTFLDFSLPSEGKQVQDEFDISGWVGKPYINKEDHQ